MAARISPNKEMILPSLFTCDLCAVIGTKQLASQIRIFEEHLTNPPSAVLSTLSAIHKSACLKLRTIKEVLPDPNPRRVRQAYCY